MKYLSIDIETTGTNPLEHKIIEFGCLLEDTANSYDKPVSQLPHYSCIITQEQKGETEALVMNHEIFALMPDWGVSQAAFLKDFATWCERYGVPKNEKGQFEIVAAGKNFGAFDLQFLNQIPGFKQKFKISHRVLDPAQEFIEPTDQKLPDLQTCLNRAGIKSQVKHNALDDAACVIQLLRMRYKRMNLIAN